MQMTGTQIPSKGDRVEQHRTGVVRHGHVWYADQLQVLVKWEDGKSNSLRLGCDYVATAAGQAARSEDEDAEPALPEPAGSFSVLGRSFSGKRRTPQKWDVLPASRRK